MAKKKIEEPSLFSLFNWFQDNIILIGGATFIVAAFFLAFVVIPSAANDANNQRINLNIMFNQINNQTQALNEINSRLDQLSLQLNQSVVPFCKATGPNGQLIVGVDANKITATCQ